MRSVIRWAIERTASMNVLMVAILLIGAISAMMIRREEFPRFDLEIILVTVPYPGASPDEVESGICLKIEEAIRSIEGIKKITSVAMEGSGSIVIEVRSDAPNVQKVLSDVESEINRIPSFPDLSEDPEIRQLTMRNPAIMVGVVSEPNQQVEAELQLRSITELVRDDLLSIPEISSAEIQGEKKYQIDVEIPQRTLREYGLTLTEVARRIRAQNVELPGGSIKDASQEYLLRGKNKRVNGEEIAEIPLVTSPTGVVLTVGDLANVKDEFGDLTSISRINGNPGMAISISAAAQEDMLAMTAAVRKYIAEKKLPPGYSFVTWEDRSIEVQDRLNLLVKNGLQGLVLVFVVLALFLDLRLSFWVALGIPVSLLGACAVLWQTGDTLNMLSMFSFLIALGIVVDDAIVVGENIYAHREAGKGGLKAAIHGTAEVVPSVVASVTTTVFAFMPMFFVSGVMGKFFAVMPLAVIAILIISLFESVFILPCHLAHTHEEDPEHPSPSWTDGMAKRRANSPSILLQWTFWPIVILVTFLLESLWRPLTVVAKGVNWVSSHFSSGLQWFIDSIYAPVVRTCLKFPAIVVCASIALLILSMSLVRNGTVPWVIFPNLDARSIEANIIFPDGTPKSVTDAATLKMEAAINKIGREIQQQNGEDVVQLVFRIVGQVRSRSPGGADQRTEGGHAGSVKVELLGSEHRTISSQTIIDRWRREVGVIPGAETLTFASVAMGPGGKAIEFKLLASGEHMQELESAIESCKEHLVTYPGVYDVADDSRPGKWELQLKVRENAQSLGVPLDDLARTVRSSYYGEEVMRLQRGRHEVKLMVRYPDHERDSLANFDDLMVTSLDGISRPITELADVKTERSFAEINRVNQKRSITVTGNVDEATANAAEVVGSLRNDFMPKLLREHPHVQVRWEGQAEQSKDSIGSLFFGFAIALLATFVLLTLQFKSYTQPLIIMAVIPFGMVGAVAGHAIMGLPLTLFSVLGLVALSGVVVNDSIVLVDFINSQVAAGVPLHEAIALSGQRRFRPVMLTSLTTIAGLFPIVTERSMQAQLLIPMATSLCFGLLLSTILVLILVPVYYSIYGALGGYKPFVEDDNLLAD